MTKNLKAIIIKGNPKYINNDLARKYYKDIEAFLKQNGVSVVEFNDGKEYTIPKLDADIYIGHSKGVDRYEHMPKDKQKVFLKFGVIDGIIDPIDLKWQKEVWTKDTDEQLPKEHFILITKQKNAILVLLSLIKRNKVDSFSFESDLITIPQEILDQANEDPILSGYINKTIQRVGIYFEDRIVGFYSPVEEEYKGKLYWRTGNIYILPEYRNKGLASKIILEFFSDKPFGMAHVAENNPASLKAFEKAGFVRQDGFIGVNPKGKNLYLLLKNAIGLESAFTRW